jgi:16S rRNA (uracil1498-N3)-methyltransferase
MQLFYQSQITETVFNIQEETARHIAQVLRMQVGDKFMLTDGLGKYKVMRIDEVGKKTVVASTMESKIEERKEKQISIAIAFTKNNNRMEWLLEKITEIGIADIYPIITQRSEHNKINLERFNKILIAAMCQSKQFYLPKIHEPIALQKLIVQNNWEQKFVAHCIDNETKIELKNYAPFDKKSIILIGPEGDFAQNEIDLCIENKCKPVSLGNTRLRTETAGLVAVTLLNNL